MILKGKERGDARQLARYLMALRDNDHVELHEVRGFVSDDLPGAFGEADAIAQGTRCKNHLFSLSLNPPQHVQVGVEDFTKAIDDVERKLGLEGQPRAIIFHEKDGRRHAHVVWSRVDSQRMRAINLAHYKVKLREISRSLYMQHGWDMPRGLQDRSLRDPLNFTREEWQQAKRAGLDPRELKNVLAQCWKASDNTASFERTLKERGFWLAKGDRRGFVAVDYRGEVYSLSRYAGVKPKDLEARLGDHKQLRSVEEARIEIASGMTRKLEAFIKDAERQARQRQAVVAFRKTEIVARQQEARKRMTAAHEQRWQAETRQRAQRLPKGFAGIWHRLTGEYGRIRAQNEMEALQALHRDRGEKDALVFKQLEERQALQRDIQVQRATAQEELLRLREDIGRYQNLDRDDASDHSRARDKDDRGEARKRVRPERHHRPRRSFDP